jgi:DNA repair photolyase
MISVVSQPVRQGSLFDLPEPEASFPSERAEATGTFVPLTALTSEAGAPAHRFAPGIARLADEAEELDYRNDVEYRELPCRSIISQVDSGRVPFPFGINPYRGCEFSCVYCYARYTHEFMELDDWREFERKIFVKQDAREALVRDLRRRDFRGQWIAIGTATDPYQPAERRHGVTRSLLEVFAERRNLRVSITTKSDLVLRDLDLLRKIREHNEVHVNLTVTTPHYELARRIELRAPRPDKRLGAVRKLSEAGIRAGVFLMPVLPRINDGLEDLELLVRLSKEAGASYLAAQVLYLRKCSKQRYFPFLEEEFPALLPYYRRLYSYGGKEELANYTRRITADLQRLKRQYGLFSEGRPEPEYVPDQLSLLE